MSEETPLPKANLRTTPFKLEAGKHIHRVHLEQYGATQLNPGLKGDARFSPITDGEGKAIPTMYAGTSLECALMETVFHDIPHSHRLKTFPKAKLVSQVRSELVVKIELQLVDLSTVALRKLGLKRSQLIDTEKDRYPATRLWAEAIYWQCPNAQGLSWVSRQDDRARAFIFFGDRLPINAFSKGDTLRLTEDQDTYTAVLDLADQIGVRIVSAKK